MSEELRELLFAQLLPGLLGLIATIVGAYFGRKGWKGWIAKKILDVAIETAVDKLNDTMVPKMKAQTMVENPEVGFDLTPIQAQTVMYNAKVLVEEEAKKEGLKPKEIPPRPVLQERIEKVVQARKLTGPSRRAKGFR
jgi:hypothetical protein